MEQNQRNSDQPCPTAKSLTMTDSPLKMPLKVLHLQIGRKTSWQFQPQFIGTTWAPTLNDNQKKKSPSNFKDKVPSSVQHRAPPKLSTHKLHRSSKQLGRFYIALLRRRMCLPLCPPRLPFPSTNLPNSYQCWLKPPRLMNNIYVNSANNFLLAEAKITEKTLRVN